MMRLRFLASLLFAGLLLAQRAPVESAWDLLAKGQRKQAIAALHEILKANAGDADARLLLGSILSEDGEHSEAIEQLSQAVRLRPSSAEARNALGEALNGFGDTKTAREAFEKAVALDPDNHFLWRFPRQRLEAEEIRDSILSVSGTLDRTMGGSLMKFKPRDYVTSTASNDSIDYSVHRRAVYLPVIRAAVYDVYTAFDFGDPSVMNGDRSSTTIAPQALFMLNSGIVLNATKAQAELLLKPTDLDDAGRVRQLYLNCYGRPATQTEITQALGFVKRFEVAYAKSPNPKLRAWQSLCKSVIAANEFIYVE